MTTLFDKTLYCILWVLVFLSFITKDNHGAVLWMCAAGIFRLECIVEKIWRKT